jgi:hypothetical protein
MLVRVASIAAVLAASAAAQSRSRSAALALWASERVGARISTASSLEALAKAVATRSDESAPLLFVLGESVSPSSVGMPRRS